MTFMLDGRQYIAVMAGTGMRAAGPGPFGGPPEPAAAAEAAIGAGQGTATPPLPSTGSKRLLV